jgi:hypothetical protein
VLTSDVAADVYLWSTGETTRSISVLTSETVSLKVLNLGSCLSEASSSVTTVVTPAPASTTVSALGATTVCAGGTVTLVAPSGFDAYLWNNGETNDTIVVNTSGNYSVRVLDGPTCYSLASNAIPVIVQPITAKPNIATSGPVTFCEGNSITLTADAGESYLWNTGATTQSITISADGIFSVRVTAANSCISPVSDTVEVNVNPVPSSPVTTLVGNATLCEGQTSLIVAPAGFASYLWSNGSTNDTLVASATGNYSVQVFNAEGCGSLASAPQAIVVNPISATPSINASGSLTFCQGGSVVLTSSIVADNYLWSNGATTSSITVSASGSYSLQVRNNGECISATSVATDVIVNPLPAQPVVSLVGAATLCEGQTTLLVAPAGFASYLWSDGSTNDSLVVNATGSYSVQVTNANGCQSTASVARTIQVNPVTATPTVNASGSLTFCQGGSVVLTSSVVANNYLWSNGATTASITVSAAGNYSLQVRNTGECISLPSVAATVTVNVVCLTYYVLHWLKPT